MLTRGNPLSNAFAAIDWLPLLLYLVPLTSVMANTASFGDKPVLKSGAYSRQNFVSQRLRPLNGFSSLLWCDPAVRHRLRPVDIHACGRETTPTRCRTSGAGTQRR